MSHPAQPDPLRPALHEVERELEKSLQEACETKENPVSGESTGELMRLEEALVEAAQKAKEAISLRRRLRTREQANADDAEGGAGDAADDRGGRVALDEAPKATGPRSENRDSGPRQASPADDRVMVREFSDQQGVDWRVWEVTPHHDSEQRRTDVYMSGYQNGWLAFESIDGRVRKRLPQFPGTWCELPPAGLESLLAQATIAPMRRGERKSEPESRE